MAEHVPQSDLRRADAPLGGWREATESDRESTVCIEDAVARVETEQDHVDGKLAAYDRFENAVRESEVDDMAGVTMAVGGSTSAVSPMAGGSSDDQCRRLRERFEATVRPCSLEDVTGTEPVTETIREELGERVALALAPDGNPRYTPQLRDGIFASIDERRAGLRAMSSAVDRELTFLREAREEIGGMIDGFGEADGRYLYEHGFNELRERHDRLEAYRTRCDRLARERQTVLASATSYGASAGMNHRTLIAYLYRSLPTNHPVLTAIVRL